MHTISKPYYLILISGQVCARTLLAFFQRMGGNNELFSRGQGNADKTDLLYIITANATFLPQPLKKARNFHQPPEKSA